ncbi:MAG: tetratricopeptide repeat protein [Thermodesulfobacteriota bacterium]
MYFKFIILLAILILAGFFYLHTQNPGTVDFVISGAHSYAVPLAVVLFVGFVFGVVLTLLNSLVVDAVRGLRGLKSRRQMRQLAEAQENYAKGAEALASGEIKSARHFLAKAVAARPDDAGPVMALSETYAREGLLKEALDVLEEGALKVPGSAGLHLAIAAASEEAGDLIRSTRALEDVLRLDPGNPRALKKLRDVKVKEGAWTEAAALQKRVLAGARDDPSRARQRALLSAIIYEDAARAAGQGRVDEAASLVREALKADPDNMAADMLSGEISYGRGKLNEAIRTLDMAAAKYREPYPLLLRIEDLYIRKSMPDKAIEGYLKQIYTRPGDMRTRQLLARLYLRLEMADKALEELESLYNESEDDCYTRVLLAEAYLRSGRPERAARLFERALALDRDLSPPFVCSGCGNSRSGWAARCGACGEWNTLRLKAGRGAVV